MFLIGRMIRKMEDAGRSILGRQAKLRQTVAQEVSLFSVGGLATKDANIVQKTIEAVQAICWP